MNKLKKQIDMNFENMNKIEEKYQPLVTNIVCYLRGKLNSIDAEEAINDINEILLGAQSREEDLKEVVGNYIEFCEDIINAYRGKDKWYSLKSYFYDFGGMSIYMFMFFIALDIISGITTIKPISFYNFLNMKYTLTLAPIVSCIISIIFSIGFVKYICTHQKEGENTHKNEWIIFFVASFICLFSIVSLSFLLKKVEIYTFTNTPIIVILAVLLCIVFIFRNVLMALKVRRMGKRVK